MNTRRYTLLLAQAVAAGLLPMIVGMLLSEVIDLEEFGRFYAGLGLAMTAVYLGGLGLDKVVLKVIVAASPAGDASNARGLRHSGPMMIAMGCLACSAILLPAFALLQGSSPSEVLELAAILLLMPLHAVLRFIFGTVTPHGGRILATVFRDSLCPVLIAGVLATLLAAGVSDLGVLHAMAIYAAAYIASITAMFLLRRGLEPDAFRSGDRAYQIPKWIRNGLDYSANVMVYVFISYSPLLYAQWVVDDDGLAALLAAAYQINVIPMSIAITFCAVLLPEVARTVANHDRSGMVGIQKRFLLYVAPPVVILAITILVLERPLLRLYGEEYLAAAPALRIILLGNVLAAITYMATNASQFLPHLSRTTICCYFMAIAGWIAFAISGGRELTAIAMMQVILLLACQGLAILLGGRQLRTWPT